MDGEESVCEMMKSSQQSCIFYFFSEFFKLCEFMQFEL